MKPKSFCPSLFASLIAVSVTASAATTGFNQTAAGPWDYNTTTNWVSDTITGVWDTSLTLGEAQTVQFAADTTLTTALTFNYAGDYGLTLDSADSTARTLKLGGNITVGTSGGTSANVVIGDATNVLNLDLNNATRTISVASGRSLTFANGVSNGSITKTSAGTLNLNGATTVGNLQVGYGEFSNAGVVALASGATLSIGSGSSNNVYIGVGTGINNTGQRFGTLDASSSTSLVANVGKFMVGGTTGGTGYAYFGASTTITAATEFGVEHGGWGFPNGYGTVTTAAGSTTTIHTPAMYVGHNTPNSTTGGSGTFTLGGSGATFALDGISSGRTALYIGVLASGNGGSSPNPNNMDLSAGSASLKLSSLVLGQSQGGGNSVTGTLTLSSNVANHLDVSAAGNVVLVGDSAGSGTPGATGTLTIGYLDATSAITSTDNSTAILLAKKSSSGTPVGTLNLNGGTLTITTTGSAIAGGGGTSNLVLGNASGQGTGMTLKAVGSNSTWIKNLTSAKIKTTGVTIDTNGNDIGIPQALLTDGTDLGGGLTKDGLGTLTLSGANTFTGATIINGGKLVVTSTSALLSSNAQIGAAELQFDSPTALAVATLTTTGGTLGGTGTITAAVTIPSGNTLVGGNASGGTFTVGGLTLDSGTTVQVASGGSGLIQVNGDYTDSLGAHTLVTGLATPGTPYPFIQWTGTSNVSDGVQANWSIQEGDTGTKNWTAANSGTWDTAASWDGFAASVTADTTAKSLSYSLTYAVSGNKAPTGGNDVVIDPAAPAITVTGPATASTVTNLQVGGTNNSSPTLTLGTGNLTVTGAVTVTGNGILDVTNAALITPTLNVNGGNVGLTHAATNITTANITAGTLTVTGGTVATANLSGTGNLAGTLAIAQVNVTGGTPSFAGNATTLTVTGGGITTTGGTIGTFNHNTGAGTSTLGAATTITTATVDAGTVNFNSTQANGTLILPAASTGTVVVGTGAKVAIADLTAGAGSLDATQALTLTNQLKLAGGFTATTDSTAFTVATSGGANLVDNASARTFTLAGGKLSLAVASAPATTGISYVQVTNDADSGLSSSNTYTHALDFGSSGAATVNGVAFATDVNQTVGSRSNSGTRTYGSAGSHPGNTPPAVSGSVAGVFQDMLYGGPDLGYIELTGLTANQWYDVRLYDRPWDGSGGRSSSYVYDVGSNGSAEFTTPVIDQNHSEYAPVSLPSNVSWVTSYIYKADSTGKLKLSIDAAPGASGTYHLYGLTNQALAVPPGTLSLPNTNIAAIGSSELNLGANSEAQLLGALALSGSGTVLTLSGAQSISFGDVTATDTGSLVGAPVVLRGSVSVAGTQTLTVGAAVVDGATPTALTKTGAGALSLGGLNTYTGNTTVSNGSLVLADDAGLTFVVTDSGSNRVIGSGSATLAGDFTIDTTAVTVGSGTWSLVSTASKSFATSFTVAGAGWSETSNIWTKVDGANTWRFNEANGTLTLNIEPGGFNNWASGFNNPALSNASPDADPDGDGLANALEYVFGTDPRYSNPGGPQTDASGNDFVLTFSRDDLSETADLALVVEVSTDLGDWTSHSAYSVGSDTLSSSVGVTVAENGTDPDTITVTIPKDSNVKMFGRLRAVVTE